MGLGRTLAFTGFAAGLPFLVAGCPIQNAPPQISISELNGTEIRSTESKALAREYGWDEAIILPVNRLDVAEGREKFIVNAYDSDGPEALTANFYAMDPLTTSIYQGANTKESINWHIELGANSTIPRGTWPIAEGEVNDGCHSYTVGILGSVSPGASFEGE
ncbi:MAG: hypothetical protein ABH864_06075 [archaeon]